MHPDMLKPNKMFEKKFYVTIKKKLTDVDEELEDESIMSMLFEFEKFDLAADFILQFKKHEISGYYYIYIIEED